MKNISDLWFASFADSRLHGALWRLRRQAKKFGFKPDKTIIIDENGLDSDFRGRMKDRLRPNVRGFGYWCWKPQTILQVLSRMSDGEILVYADAGCHLNPRGRDRLLSYIPLVEKQGLGVFQGKSPEKKWTKGDLFDHFNSRTADLTDSGQIIGGILLAQKRENVITLFREHLTLLQEHPELVDDSPSRSPNFHEFIENRHDQSAFSLRCKIARLETFDALDTCDISDGIERPIIAQRDLGVGWRGYVPLSVKRFCFKCKDALH